MVLSNLQFFNSSGFDELLHACVLLEMLIFYGLWSGNAEV